jgi:autotransporter-associated beta strand protein
MKPRTVYCWLSMILFVSLVFLQAGNAAAQRVLGLDISAWQGNISQTTWNNFRNLEDRQFVFLRSSRGGTTGFYNQSNPGNNNPPGQNTLSQRYDDPFFVQNINRATAAGIFSGSYHFSRPDIVESTLNSGGIANSGFDEANHFIEMAGAWMRPGYLLPVHDFEAGQGARTNNQMAQFCIDFTDRVYEVMQVRPAMYTNGNYASILGGASASLRQEVVQKYPILWLARWPNQSNPDAIDVQNGHPSDSLSWVYGPWDDYGVAKPWQFWQYASTGRLQSFNNGNSNLDFNVCQGDQEYLKDIMVPAVWLSDSDGQWTELTNWNCGLPPIVPIPGPGQVQPVGAQTLPTPRLPGTSGSGIASGQNDIVVLDRPNSEITVTHSSGTHNVRKLFVRENLVISGGSLIVNYDPDYISGGNEFPNALRSGTVSATFSSPVTLTGSGSLTVHTLQIDPQASFQLGGEYMMFCRMLLMPHNENPARLVVTNDVRFMPFGQSPMHVAACAGAGKTGVVDLGGRQRRFEIGQDSATPVLTISVPIVNGGLVKDGPGTLALTGLNEYQGDTSVLSGTLRLSRPTLSQTSTVSMVSGSTLRLDFSGKPNTIRSLVIDGAAQPAGTWGAIGSGAMHTTPLISGAGQLFVEEGATLQDSLL